MKYWNKTNAFIIVLLLILTLYGCNNPDTLSADNGEASKGNSENNEDKSIGSNRLDNIRSSLDLKKGRLNDNYPYISAFDGERIVTENLEKEGGVISADLADNVKLYIIMPQGGVIQSTVTKVIISPYKELPATSQHPALGEELGYGAHVELKTSQLGIKAYAVFDTSEGVALEKIRSSKIIRNRCDFTKTWFNPAICARNNKLGEKFINKELTIVSPVSGNTLSLRDTYDIGIEGVIVTQVERGSQLLLPQKLDKGHVQNILNNNMAGSDAESTALALEWDIPLENFPDSVHFNEDATGKRKSFLLAKKILDSEDVKVKDRFESQYSEMAPEFRESIKSQHLATINDQRARLESSLQQQTQDYFKRLNDKTKNFKGGLDFAEGSAIGGDLADAGISGAEAGAESLGNSIESAANNAVQDPSKGSIVVDAGEAAHSLGRPKIIDIEPSLKKGIDNVLNNQKSTIRQLFDAAALAQALGDDEKAEKIIDKIREIIEGVVNDPNASPGSLNNAAEVGQVIGADDVADKALERLGLIGDCDTLINKNLKNFGNNRCE